MTSQKTIYLDNAATTPVRDEVVKEMLPYFTDRFGNPSGIYKIASDCKADMTRARGMIAKTINANQDEIYFTAGGSESDNWALKAVAECNEKKGKHIITTKIEHHAILHTCKYLEKRGFEITYVDVGENGIIKLDRLIKAIRPDTILISVMFANNEVGTIQPIKKIGEIAKRAGIIFHTDAVQAYTNIPIDVNELNIDMLSVSSHKINGPKGIGFLYVRNSVNIDSFIHGGAQERNKRAGTENVPGIMGLAKAAELACDEMTIRTRKEMELRDYLINRVFKEIPYVRLNGDRFNRLPNNANFSFQFVDGATLLVMLDMKGICASSGSACTTGSPNPSHVLMAMGLPKEIAYGALRLTLGKLTTKEDIDYTIQELKKAVASLRNKSVDYQKYARRRF